MAFEQPKLKYAYDALEPNIDAQTMEVHYSKHHAGYTKKLNNAIEGTDLAGKNIENIMVNLDMSNTAVRNNGGGFYNHNLFWEVMSPNGGGKPTGDLAEAINDKFGSFEAFKEEFAKAAAGQFGSGWAWLCVHEGGKVDICSTPNQDNPLMPGVGCGGHPILGLDVWEHAYYLKYQNKRPDYINAFFNVINWEEVSAKYAKSK
ncbi:superoxide dismutase [Mesonia aquimarina]|uniref:superoxide dismutase n=1 Tax=Mesonia aquimarina TaxID=1504967 RepID=UPI000EF61E5A|nr:superoxide dismutase [Mesonia aquimarina]